MYSIPFYYVNIFKQTYKNLVYVERMQLFMSMFMVKRYNVLLKSVKATTPLSMKAALLVR